MRRFTTLLITLAATLPGFSWDVVGHRIISDVAYRYLTPEARTSVDRVLGYERAMVALSSWADEIQNDTIYPQQKVWHYQDMDAGKTPAEVRYLYEHKDAEGYHLFCAKDSLVRLLHETPDNADALKFVVHLCGDEFQPMHMGHHNDLGGNKVTLYWFGQRTNMHTLWDRYMIDHTRYSSTEFADYLCRRFASRHEEIEGWDELRCIQQTYDAATAIYNYYDELHAQADDKGHLPRGYEYGYTYRFRPTLDLQLYMAGVQLAKVLNDIYK